MTKSKNDIFLSTHLEEDPRGARSIRKLLILVVKWKTLTQNFSFIKECTRTKQIILSMSLANKWFQLFIKWSKERKLNKQRKINLKILLYCQGYSPSLYKKKLCFQGRNKVLKLIFLKLIP